MLPTATTLPIEPNSLEVNHLTRGFSARFHKKSKIFGWPVERRPLAARMAFLRGDGSSMAGAGGG
jgi:hypothetical protein